MGRLLILEGPDGAGKSTLLNQLKGETALQGAVFLHHGAYPECGSAELFMKFVDSLRPLLEGRDVVLDRCWHSEPIYGPVYRGQSRLTRAQVRMLDRIAITYSARLALCLPALETCLEVFNSRHGEEMLDNTDQLRAVYQQYATWPNQLPTVIYNWQEPEAEVTYERLLTPATAVPQFVLVGDSPGPEHLVGFEHVPFVSASYNGCSWWLAEQLDSIGVPERDLRFINAHQADGTETDPTEVFNLGPQIVVALGTEATFWCQRHGIVCEAVQHPQYHKRFKHNQPYKLLEVINAFRE